MRTTMFGALVGILLAMTWAIVDFGAMLGERTLVPADGARLGEIRFQEWLGQPVLQPR